MSEKTICEVCSQPVGTFRLRDGSQLGRCVECGHVVRDLVAGAANHRSLAYGGDPGLDRIRLGLTFRTLIRLIPMAAGRKVFEIGFGSGALLRRFYERGSYVAGCDSQQLGAKVDRLVMKKGDLIFEPLESINDRLNGFDLVFGVHVIEHVLEPAKSFEICHRLLRDDGRLALMTPAADSWSVKVFSQAWWLLEDPTDIRFYSRKSAVLALSNAGFVDIRARRLLLDNLTMEGASVLRLFDRKAQDGGILVSRAAMAFCVLLSPLALAVRLAVPRFRPTMLVTARRSN